MNFETWAAFAAIWIAFVAFPGPNSVYVMAVGSRRGLGASFAAAAGFALAVTVYVVLVGLGLLAFLAASADAFEMLRWAGVGYLIYLAWKTWRAPTDNLSERPLTLPEATGVLSKAALISLTNPKSALSYVLVYPPFLNAERDPTTSLVVMGATSVVLCLAVYTCYGFAAGHLGRLIRTRRQALIRNRLFAAVFAIGGFALAVSERR